MNTLFETILGLAVVYLLVCLLASGLEEMIARLMGTRGHFLRLGLQSLLSHPWVYLRTIHDPGIAALYRGQPGKGDNPSYVPGERFAQALCNVLLRRHWPDGKAVFDLENVRTAVRDARDKQLALGDALLPIVESAQTLEDALAGVSRWYDQGMERVSGWYKAHAQKRLFFIGLLIAAVLNIDSIAIVQTLARDDAIRAQIATAAPMIAADYAEEVEQRRTRRATASSVEPAPKIIGDGHGSQEMTPATLAETSPQEPAPAASGTQGESVLPADLLQLTHKELEQIHTTLDRLAASGLPIGYECLGPGRTAPCDLPQTLSAWPIKLAGVLLTALAATLGAPFWFDLINHIVSLRSSGKRPEDSKGKRPWARAWSETSPKAV